jgi:undecaprenyl pyrophosphate synthase
MGFRDLVYRLYEQRLESSLTGKAIPRHVGVMTDGNRRWARSAGHTDVSKGHRKGADKIFELLQWCRHAGVEVVTLWLLSTDNLSRPQEELGPLLAIIEDTVTGLVDEGWHVNAVGALDLLPDHTARVLKDAGETTPASWSTSPSATEGGARSPTRSGRCSLSTRAGAPRSSSSPRSSTSSTSPSTSTRRASPTRTW